MKKFSATIFVLVLFACFCLTSFFVVRAKRYPLKYVDEICNFSSQNNLPPALVASVINAESSFDKNAKSSKGAIGLMQIKLSTANYLCDYYKLKENLTENDLFEVNTNLKYGCLYLKYLINKFGDINTALASYNAGETVVRFWLKNQAYSLDGKTLDFAPYQETENYVKKVNKNLKFYSKKI